MRVINSLMFFPRGGSAQVARSLSAELAAHDWDVRIVSGSMPGPGDATRFYAGQDLVAVDFSAGDAPMHPSYEDRPGAPDVCFARVDDEEYEAHVEAWTRVFDHAGAASADVLLLHHLTPMNEAAARAAPGVPIVGHLHGTELAMLDRASAGPRADAWARRMRRWAGACAQLIVPTTAARDRAVRLLGVDPAVCVVVANGFDPALFRPEAVDRAAWWRRTLVDDPHGWRPGDEPGSVAYTEEHVARLDHAVVLLAVGRYTAVKRLSLLIDAFTAARKRTRRDAALVILGGHPGEWEGEHPADAVRRAGSPDVFLAGWHDHDELGGFFNASDVQVLASVDEQFGLVLVEGMACGLAPIAVDRAGPATIVEDGRTGWLVEPDDGPALAMAIVDAVDGGEERARRGIAARHEAQKRWGWPGLAGQVAGVLASACAATGVPARTRA
ncbi:glycosyltransferase family 4 protein [Svornostia abyssi]|uniref:Glycosyltransferase family 4 protein n=1 Tax=Svornostia abyssi TaxID=2898438 RepID=A0ABY5PGP0_9ACTN|nr:glycosyltransferase family 4 protein [Parviterribacteraceae bacterium J379]